MNKYKSDDYKLSAYNQTLLGMKRPNFELFFRTFCAEPKCINNIF